VSIPKKRRQAVAQTCESVEELASAFDEAREAASQHTSLGPEGHVHEPRDRAEPENTSAERRRASRKAELVALFGKLDRRTSNALLAILETLTDMDRRRASRLLEALTFLLALAPRRDRRSVRP